MRQLLLAGTIMGALAIPAYADTIDPLHGYDIQCTPTCVDVQTSVNGISPLGAGDHFGFIVDQPGGGNATGDFILAVLIPTNEIAPLGVSVTGTITGSGTINDSSLFRGIWNSGDLETFLGLPNGSPNNPIGAFTQNQDIADPNGNPTAFAVFTIDVGSLTLLHTLLGDPMNLNIGGLPAGSLITGFLVQGPPGSPTDTTIDTANSSVLMVNATAVPVPLPIVGAGIPGLIAGCLGLLGLNIKRRRRKLVLV